jgi:hypothetical protein
MQMSSSPLVEWVLDNFLTQHVDKPTRPDSQSILDLILSPLNTEISNVCIKECFGSSDHAILIFDVTIPGSICPHDDTSGQLVSLFSQAKWCLYRRLLLNSHWPTSDMITLEDLWVTYRENILNAAAASIPQALKKPWTPRSSARVRSALRKHRRLCSSLTKDPQSTNLSNRLQHKLSLDALKRVIYTETCKQEHFVARNISSNSKPFWSYVKTKMKSSFRTSVIEDSEGEAITNPSLIAESFSKHFAHVFQEPGRNFLSSLHPTSVDILLDNVYFSPQLVNRFIKSLPLSTSLDPEGICYEFLRKGGFLLACKLSFLFNRSMMACMLPSSWKMAHIIPIHKSGDRKQCTNYRPIAITCCTSRLMERIICKQLLSSLQIGKVLHLTQHGFIPRRSIETAGLVHMEQLTQSLDGGGLCDVVFLDFSKAFDTVPHTLLLEKLFAYGIRGNLLSWLTDYLSQRFQVISINGSFSSPVPISSGVVQGSVLGPLLFSIFVNDVDNVIESSNVIKYADDIKLTISFSIDCASQASRKLQEDLHKLHCWSLNNGLSLNPAKCKIMHFGHKNPSHLYSLDDRPLNVVSCTKDLGIYVSDQCTFHEHVSYISTKANKMLGLVRHAFVSRNENVLLMLYKTYVRSILEFGSLLWCPYRKFLSDRVESVQRRFSRMFPELKHLSYRQRLTHLKLQSLYARRIRYRLIFLYKIVNNLVDVDLESLFSYSTSSVTRGNSRKLILPSSSRDYRRYFFSVDTVLHWNSLTESEVMVDSVAAFKKSVNAYFQRNDIW